MITSFLRKRLDKMNMPESSEEAAKINHEEIILKSKQAAVNLICFSTGMQTNPEGLLLQLQVNIFSKGFVGYSVFALRRKKEKKI